MYFYLVERNEYRLLISKNQFVMKRYKIAMQAGVDKLDGHYVWILDNTTKLCKVYGKDAADVDMKAERIVDLLNANMCVPNKSIYNTYC